MGHRELFLPAGENRTTLFQALAHRRRRYALAYLCSTQTPVSQTAVTYAVAELETGESRDDISGEECKQMYSSLHHSHLPHLVDADLVIHDHEADEVALTDHARQFESALRTLTEEPRVIPFEEGNSCEGYH